MRQSVALEVPGLLKLALPFVPTLPGAPSGLRAAFITGSV